MLAKVPKKRLDGRSSFASLISYVSKCASTLVCSESVWSVETVAAEMRRVSLMNERVKYPAYHYVLSWPAQDVPTDEQATDAVRTSLTDLHLLEHQWIGAVHRNTNNVHVHVAVNRINPTTLKSVYPKQDWIVLDHACRALELKYGWSHDRGPHFVVPGNGPAPHIVRGRRNRSTSPAHVSAKARDFSAWTGLDSFQTWVGKEPAVHLKHALRKALPSWQDLHEALGAFNLEYRLKGSGAIVVDGSEPYKLCAKASHLGRFASRSKLEAVLGPFQEPVGVQRPDEPRTAPVIGMHGSYHQAIAKPLLESTIRRGRGDDLYERFVRSRAQWKAVGRVRYRKAWERQRRSESSRLDALREQSRAARQHIRLMYPVRARRILYSFQSWLSAALRQELQGQFGVERGQLTTKRDRDYPARWPDWLQQQAAAGEETAKRRLRSLRLRERRNSDVQAHSNELGSVSSSELPRPAMLGSFRVVADHGGLNYYLKGLLVFRDDGRRVALFDADEQSIRAGLLLCREKWGPKLFVSGSETFERMVRSVAAGMGISLSGSEAVEGEKWLSPTIREQLERLSVGLTKSLIVCPPEAGRRHTGKIVAVVTGRTGDDDDVVVLDLGRTLGAFRTPASIARTCEARVGRRVVLRAHASMAKATNVHWQLHKLEIGLSAELGL